MQVAHVGSPNLAPLSLQLPATGGACLRRFFVAPCGCAACHSVWSLDVSKGWTRRATFQALRARLSVTSSDARTRAWSEIEVETSGTIRAFEALPCKAGLAPASPTLSQLGG